MPEWLRWLSAVNPLSYEVNALRGLLIGTPTNAVLDVAVLVIAAVAGIAMASAFMRRLVR
jgi:ABC-2 type transport system permease protein